MFHVQDGKGSPEEEATHKSCPLTCHSLDPYTDGKLTTFCVHKEGLFLCTGSQIQAEGLLSRSKAQPPPLLPDLRSQRVGSGAQSEFQGHASWAVPVGWGGPRICF